MNKGLKVSLLSAALAVCALPVVAQNTSAQGSATASTPATQGSAAAGANTQAPHGTVRQRQENQHDRIANGVKSGQLTKGEAAHLERNQARINHQVRADRQANGGKLTPQERAQVTREQNRQSRQIYRAKHNNKHQ
jgi:predicted transglutaminase-like cysteine proteinase